MQGPAAFNDEPSTLRKLRARLALMHAEALADPPKPIQRVVEARGLRRIPSYGLRVSVLVP